MIQPGQQILNPRNGERFTFLQTHASSGGKVVEMGITLPAGQPHSIPKAHLHPKQQKSFLVKSGQMWLKVNGEKRLITAGQAFYLPAGMAHQWGNAGDQVLHVRCELQPALHAEDVLETMIDTTTVEKPGWRNWLCWAQLLQQYPQHLKLTGLGTWLLTSLYQGVVQAQKVGLPIQWAKSLVASSQPAYQR